MIAGIDLNLIATADLETLRVEEHRLEQALAFVRGAREGLERLELERLDRASQTMREGLGYLRDLADQARIDGALADLDEDEVAEHRARLDETGVTERIIADVERSPAAAEALAAAVVHVPPATYAGRAAELERQGIPPDDAAAIARQEAAVEAAFARRDELQQADSAPSEPDVAAALHRLNTETIDEALATDDPDELARRRVLIEGEWPTGNAIAPNTPPGPEPGIVAGVNLPELEAKRNRLVELYHRLGYNVLEDRAAAGDLDHELAGRLEGAERELADVHQAAGWKPPAIAAGWKCPQCDALNAEAFVNCATCGNTPAERAHVRRAGDTDRDTPPDAAATIAAAGTGVENPPAPATSSSQADPAPAGSTTNSHDPRELLLEAARECGEWFSVGDLTEKLDERWTWANDSAAISSRLRPLVRLGDLEHNGETAGGRGRYRIVRDDEREQDRAEATDAPAERLNGPRASTVIFDEAAGQDLEEHPDNGRRHRPKPKPFPLSGKEKKTLTALQRQRQAPGSAPQTGSLEGRVFQAAGYRADTISGFATRLGIITGPGKADLAHAVAKLVDEGELRKAGKTEDNRTIYAAAKAELA